MYGSGNGEYLSIHVTSSSLTPRNKSEHTKIQQGKSDFWKPHKQEET